MQPSLSPHAILPLGDTAAYVEFSETLDLQVNARAQQLAQALRDAQLSWLSDIVPTLGGVALHFNMLDPHLPNSPIEDVATWVGRCLADLPEAALELGREIAVPVCYAPQFGIDLASVAANLSLSQAQVVELHLTSPHRVLMMGFSPGQPYVGGLDPTLAVPRRSSPRAKVPAGSIAIANTQTAIYPFETPGGWSIIGRTPLKLFDASREPACLLSPSDRLRFVPISEEEFGRQLAKDAAAKSADPQAELETGGIRVLRPGMLTSLQDLGRMGQQHLGIVPSGAMDAVSHRLANALVGNSLAGGGEKHEEEATLEITLIGPELAFQETLLVALCGAQFQASIAGEAFPLNRPVLVQQGARLHIQQTKGGARGYLAVAGGFAVPMVLGSRSTYLPAGFGGLKGRALKAGDVLALNPNASQISIARFDPLRAGSLARSPAGLRQRSGRSKESVSWFARTTELPSQLPGAEPLEIHAMPGMHFEWFTKEAQATIFEADWQLCAESNRIGFRLQGPELKRQRAGDIMSGPTCLGTVQVPASGQPIVLMADHQTTGGYAKILELASVDVARLAQLIPGQKLRFVRCNLEEALQKRYEAELFLKSQCLAIQAKFTEVE